MARNNQHYIYAYLRSDTIRVQFDIFTRKLNENDANMYVEYICEDGFKPIPETLPIWNDAQNPIVLNKTQDILLKIFAIMQVVGRCDESPILMFHGTVEEFLRSFD